MSGRSNVMFWLEKRGLKFEEFGVPSGNLTMQQMVARQVDMGTYAGPSLILGHDKGGLVAIAAGLGVLVATMAIGYALWLAMFLGYMQLPTRFDPPAWHVHEMLFGFVMAAAVSGHGCGPRVAAGVARGSTGRGPGGRGGFSFLTGCFPGGG